MFSPIFLVSLYICIFVVGISLLAKIFPSYKRIEIKWLIVFVTSVCVVTFCSLNVYVVNSFEAKILFSRLRYIGHGIIGQAWFFFLLLTFSKNKILKSPFIVVPLVAISLVTIFLAISPSYSYLLVNNYTPYNFNGVNLVKFSTGPWFTVHILCSYLCAMAANMYVVYNIFKSRGVKRSQLIALAIGGNLGLAFDSYSVVTSSALRWSMLSAGTFLISEASILYAISKHGLLDLANIAKKQIFQSLSDPLLILDNDKNIIDYNKAAYTHFHINKKNSPFPFKDLNLEKKNQEWKYIRGNNQVYFYQVSIEPLQLYNGMTLLFKEVTAQKEIESALTHNLDFKAKLLSMMAHDFSGVLSTQSYLSSKLEEVISPEFRSQVGDLTNVAFSNKELMNNILLWARAQENEFKPILKDYEVNALIKEVLSSVERISQLKNIEMKFTSNLQDLVMSGDVVMIESVVRNILTNAIRATPQDGLIKINLIKNNESAKIIIEDTGNGMSANKLEKIRNEKFDKSEGTEGFGIGLTIARRFVKLHAGELNFHSVEGVGTLVSLTLPFKIPSC